MNTLVAIDGALLYCFERFSHFMQRTFGTRAVDLERFCLMAALLFLLLREGSLGGKIFLGIFCTLSFAFTYVRDPIPPGTMNPRKIRYQTTRPIFFLMAVAFSWSDSKAFNFWYQFWRIADYFEACDDLPPGESRVRKFVNGLKGAFRQPVPVQSCESFLIDNNLT